MTIRRLLVANRGEIARRVFRTCRELGIDTVAVFSDADAGLPFVSEADLAVRLPGNSPAETYLRGDLVIEAALTAGADAIHPGYGFLSENADFARAVGKAGLTWVGPTPESMDAMATKVEAKRLMAEAGVPVLAELDPAALTAADLPVLVKASSGGGGRGMRVIRSLDAVAETVALASAEAASAFGDPTVFCEPYVERGRHIEVQVLGEHDGTRTHVIGARDCSVQRRHQKVVEEAPPANLPEPVAAALAEAARVAGEAIGYVGAGTVEFLYDAEQERFFFLEMNTRLQVEHPVTELVTGLDLVAQQLAVAEGRSLGLAPEVTSRGHAIEARLYAEDPSADYQPQSGTLTRFEVPGVTGAFANLAGAGIRVDSGVGATDTIGTHYDAMIAKVIAWAPTRAEAARRLAGALRRAEIHGLRTNRDLLVEILEDATFLSGDATTAYLREAPLRALAPAEPDPGATARAAFAAAVACTVESVRGRAVQRRIPAGFRNVVSQPQQTAFTRDGADLVARWYGGRDGFVSADLDARVVSCEAMAGATRVVVEHDGTRTAYTVRVTPTSADVESVEGHVPLARVARFTDPADQVAEGSLLAPMPGSVIAVHAAVGDQVTSGQPVLVMEAMKMQHTISAPYDGVVAEVPVAVGAQVTAGDVLAVVHPAEDASAAPGSEGEAAS